MIIKRNFSPQKVLPYIWRELALAAASAGVVIIAHDQMAIRSVALPFGLIGVLGTALAIFLAFRNNTSYSRWGEASQQWANLTSTSRVFGRLIISFTNSHAHTAQYQPEQAAAFKREMLYRHLAWINALRLELRQQTTWHELAPFLEPSELQTVLGKQNKPNYLLQLQGKRIYDAMANGTLQGFDSFQLEGCMLQLSNQHSACERIKTIPVLRQYDFFTRVFVHLFVILVPFCLIGTLATTNLSFMLLPLTLVIAFMFSTIERVGAVNEDPFENRIQDVPLSAICRTIERDLREQLDETSLPPRLEPQNGYLF